MAEITTELRRELIALTGGMFKAAPGLNYLNQMVSAWQAGASLSTIANSLSMTVQFGQVYPPLESASEFAARLVANLLGNEVLAGPKAWANDWIIGQLSGGMTRADVILTAVQALRSTTNAAYANAKLALANKVEVAEYYSITKLLSDTDLPDLQVVIAGVTSSPATVLVAKVKLDNAVGGFETLALGTDASGVYSAAGFTAIKHGLVAGDVEFTAVAGGTGLTITASPTKNTTYTLADNSGSSDSLALTLSDAAIITTGIVTATGVETVVIIAEDTASTLTNITHEVTIAGNTVKIITAAGDAGLELFATSAALTNFDASGMTNANAGVIFVTGSLAGAATLTGSAGADVINASLATKAVTLNGGDGADTLTMSNNQNNTVNGGAGNDTIFVGGGSNTINAGDGNDIIHVGASTGLNTINVGAGADTVILHAPPPVAGLFTSVTGLGAGDKLNFDALTTNTSSVMPLGARIVLGGASDLATYLNVATSGDADAAAIIKWFQVGGSTYIVVDNGTGADTSTYEHGVDSVIELTGLVDLSAATVAGDVVTLV